MITHANDAPVNPKRVLILGGSGFVGQDLVRHLSQLGIPIQVLSSGDVDLADPLCVGRLKGIISEDDSVVFVSALTPDKGRDIATFTKNIAMVENFCSFLRESRCAHVVYISSDAVYHDDAHPVQEDSCCEPSGFHGMMHLARERMLEFTLKDSGIPLVHLRPSLLYGAEDTHNGYGPNRFARLAKSGDKIVLFGGGEEKRDHVYVQDLSRIVAACLTRSSSGILNVATGESTSFHDVADKVAGLSSTPVTVEETTRANPITHRHFDISVTLKSLPNFQFTPLDDGLKATVKGMA